MCKVALLFISLFNLQIYYRGDPVSKSFGKIFSIFLCLVSTQVKATEQVLPLKATWTLHYGYPDPKHATISTASVDGTVRFNINEGKCSATFAGKQFSCEIRTTIDLGFNCEEGTTMVSAFFKKADYLEIINISNTGEHHPGWIPQTMDNLISNGIDINFASKHTAKWENHSCSGKSYFGGCSTYTLDNCVVQSWATTPISTL